MAKILEELYDLDSVLLGHIWDAEVLVLTVGSLTFLLSHDD